MLVRKNPSLFTRFAKGASRLAGRPATFAVASISVIAWAVMGPVFHYSEAWQLTINTATTIITFLMVFLIQATQNRDAEALQIKLDEVIRALAKARNELLDTEEMEEEDLEELKRNYLRLAERARDREGDPREAHMPDLAEKAEADRRKAG